MIEKKLQKPTIIWYLLTKGTCFRDLNERSSLSLKSIKEFSKHCMCCVQSKSNELITKTVHKLKWADLTHSWKDMKTLPIWANTMWTKFFQTLNKVKTMNQTQWQKFIYPRINQVIMENLIKTILNADMVNPTKYE